MYHTISILLNYEILSFMRDTRRSTVFRSCNGDDNMNALRENDSQELQVAATSKRRLHVIALENAENVAANSILTPMNSIEEFVNL